MPLSDNAVKKIKKAQAIAREEGFELFCFGVSGDFEGELATIAPADMTREEVADVAEAFANCLRDKGTADIGGTCVPPVIN